MKLSEAIKILQERGVNIKYRRRGEKEGKGVRITQINGVKFTGSSGNIVARGLLGAPIERRPKKTPLPKEIKSALRKAQAVFRKKGVSAGKPTTKNIRYVLETEGEKVALNKLQEAERYARGLAYTENLKATIERLKNDKTIAISEGAQADASAIEEIIKLINQKALTITEDQLVLILAIIYDPEQNRITWGEALKQIKDLLQ